MRVERGSVSALKIDSFVKTKNLPQRRGDAELSILKFLILFSVPLRLRGGNKSFYDFIKIKL